ncbi:MAG: DNA-binding response OmpR family regulator [Candidatus Endobugula sp.]|jgi:DNA-binding response OmpR family regulator
MSSTNYAAIRVLIVDDFHNFRSALTKSMYALGFRHISSASSGYEALNACQKNHYDLILSDYNLGNGKTGQQLLEELRLTKLLKPSDIFMLISADTSRDVVMASCDCEPSDYLTKPITGKTLEQRIRRLMAKRVELVDAYQAIEDEENQRAIHLLQNLLAESSRYSVDCQKLLGELYIREGHYDQAEKFYRGILDVRSLDWAQVGLANVDIERGKLNEAVSQLEEVVKAHPACLKAYDSLSKACVNLGDTEKLQKVLEQASAVSPMSIGRQKILADTALANGDVEIAMLAYKKTIKYGAHSHYDNADNHLNLARAITKVYDNDLDKGKNFSVDAAKLLSTIDDHQDISEDQKIQAKLLHSQINAIHGNKRVSQELLAEAQELMINSDARNIDIEVESVNALIANNNVPEAKSMLLEMLVHYKLDQPALEKIDPLLDEPISEKGKKIIATINKKGIDYYNEKNFSESIAYFIRAQKKFPRYIGLKLNLIQAMISDIRESGFNQEYVDKCLTTFKAVENNVTPASAKFHRYKQLKLMYRTVVQQAEFEAKVTKVKEQSQQEGAR